MLHHSTNTAEHCATAQDVAETGITKQPAGYTASGEVCAKLPNSDLKREFSRQVSAKGNGVASQGKAKLPDDLARLAAVWEKIPAAVRQTWLATAEALAGEKPRHA